MKSTPKSVFTKTLRAFAAITIIAIMASCNSDNGPNFQTVYRPIDSIAIPDTISMNKDYDFEIFYEKLSDCDEFAGFNAQNDSEEKGEDGEKPEENNSYVITALVNMYDRSECAPFEEPKLVKGKLQFNTDKEKPYKFKFLKGVDENDKPIFIEKTVYIESTADSTATE